MPLHFGRARPAREVEADHLEGPLGGLAACVQHDQQAGDDAKRHLDLDALWLGRQEMATAQQLLEHPEECLNHPSSFAPC